MEKSFLRLKKVNARHAFIEAEAATAIAHQIRIVRQQRGLSQKQLAKMLGTTQTAVSRLEDPSYGRLTVSTLVQLAKAFDVGLSIKFVSLVKQFKETRVIERQTLEVNSFEDEAENVVFYTNQPKRDFLAMVETNISTTQNLVSFELLKDGTGVDYFSNPSTAVSTPLTVNVSF